jgi:hypothetical protein
MEFFILIISVPLVLIVVLLISVFVLANYSGNEPAQSAPPAAGAPGGPGLPQAGTSTSADTGPFYLIGWALTLGIYAIFVIAMISALKVQRRK